ncbi:unnamed protein product [Psylliodes chrysocephalus]|uniref:Regulatory protein zeste n=1 Tax=Psylliodes chrysocephalus TaxID=3402493 RepID=A0A9P0CKG9_9CUCU|nr:unnamed protein product [Psylliodes chrysocephala]
MNQNREQTVKRIPNFTKSEKECLMNLILNNYAATLENKKTNRVNMQEKNEIWKRIECDFNSKAPLVHYRSAEQLRRLYENKKKELRKKLAEHKKQTYLTGGGPPPTDIKVDAIDKILMQIVNKKSLSGFSVEYDSDIVDEAEPIRKKSKEDEIEDVIYEFEASEFKDIDIIENIIENEQCPKSISKRCPPQGFQKPLNEKLKVQPTLKVMPPTLSLSCVSTSGTSNSNKTPKFSARRRPTGGVKTLTSSDFAEKYVLLDKRSILVEKQIEQITEQQYFVREEQKRKLKIFQQQEDNLNLEKEERKMKIELLQLEINKKKS